MCPQVQGQGGEWWDGGLVGWRDSRMEGHSGMESRGCGAGQSHVREAAGPIAS